MAKKSERKRLVSRLDKVFGDYIKHRDKRCVVCGSRQNLQCGHLFTRAAYSTRWNDKNAFAQCRSCNLRHEYDAYGLTKYFLDKFDQKEYENLHKIHKQPHKFSNHDLAMLIVYWRSKLEEYI